MEAQTYLTGAFPVSPERWTVKRPGRFTQRPQVLMVGKQADWTAVLKPLHTCLVGLLAFLRDVLPVDGKPTLAKRT